MKAVLINEYGAADVLRYTDVADPTVNDDDVLIPRDRDVGQSCRLEDTKRTYEGDGDVSDAVHPRLGRFGCGPSRGKVCLRVHDRRQRVLTT